MILGAIPRASLNMTTGHWQLDGGGRGGRRGERQHRYCCGLVLIPSLPPRSKRHKSGSMEDDIDTSPGGEYYTSSNSPTSSSRNWTEDMEGGRCLLLLYCPSASSLLPYRHPCQDVLSQPGHTACAAMPPLSPHLKVGAACGCHDAVGPSAWTQSFCCRTLLTQAQAVSSGALCLAHPAPQLPLLGPTAAAPLLRAFLFLSRQHQLAVH